MNTIYFYSRLTFHLAWECISTSCTIYVFISESTGSYWTGWKQKLVSHHRSCRGNEPPSLLINQLFPNCWRFCSESFRSYQVWGTSKSSFISTVWRSKPSELVESWKTSWSSRAKLHRKERNSLTRWNPLV